MRVRSPAKINLHLRIGPVQANGFHPLVSWMVTVGLFDTLDFSLDTAGRVALRCSDPTLPCDESNLIVRAARALQAEALASEGATLPAPPLSGANIRLTKVIPMGGGLGGGSSNAATTLATLNDLWKLSLSKQHLTEIAAALGSDVPFFLNGSSSICTGRGEVVRPVVPPRARWAVLMLPDMSMPTPAVYRQFDAMSRSHDSAWDEAVDWTQWASLSAEALLCRLQNDLEPPAFALTPELGALRSTVEQFVSRPVRMSGSGSTLFTLFDTTGEAVQTAEEIRHRHAVKTHAVKIAPEEVDG